MPLSAREQKILAGIEDELGRKDPTLAATFAKPRRPSSFWQRAPLSKAHLCLLVLALLTLVVLQPFALALGGPAGLGLLTGVLIVSWMVYAARAGGTRFHKRPRKRRGPGLGTGIGRSSRTRLDPFPAGGVNMFALVVGLLLAWLALSILAAHLEGLALLALVAGGLFLATAGYAAIKRRAGRRIP